MIKLVGNHCGNISIGTYAEITANDNDRIFLTNIKAAFDTIQYSIAYALIPVFIGFGINIREIGLYFAPLSLKILIAVALIKEDSTMPGAVKKYGEDESSVEDEEHVSMIEGVKWTLNSKAFRAWLIIHGCFNLGLQMFLSGQNVLISGPMGLNGFQTALASFALGMVCMSAAYVLWVQDAMVRMILGAAGGVICSYGIGAFFSAPTAMPTQISAEQKRTTGKSYPSMFFALQGIVNSIVGAVGHGLIWVNLRNVSLNGNDLFGTHAMTYIVIIFCVLAIFACNLLPAEYDKWGKK